MCVPCKIPINEDAKASIAAFERLTEHEWWGSLTLPQKTKYLERAMAIDKEMIARYRGLNQEMALAMHKAGTAG